MASGLLGYHPAVLPLDSLLPALLLATPLALARPQSGPAATAGSRPGS